MSSRYSLFASAEQIQERFSAEVSPAYKPTWNAMPGQLLPIITNTGPQGLSFFYWGLAPVWAKNKPVSEKFYHVRAEHIAEKPALKKALAQQRCLIPADGFYEWKKVGKKTSIPFRYRLPDKSLFAFAGLWEEYEDDGENFHTFSVITLAATEEVKSMAERIPAILSPENEKSWLDNNTGHDGWLACLGPAEFLKLDNYSISPRISAPGANDPGLIAPAPPTDQLGNLTLFD